MVSIIWIIALVFLVILLVGWFRWTSFPGKIEQVQYQPKVSGNMASFQQGDIYRYNDLPPLLSVFGTHYQMGLQYGVLLRPEILKALRVYHQILRREAKKRHIPFPLLVAFLKYRAKRMAARLPERFRKEIQGVADGSGVRQDVVLTVSLLYDVAMSLGCTSVLMKGKDGTIIHGRNNDWPESSGLGRLTVVVRHQATGFQTVTHCDFPLWLGVETGMNNAGLGFSEETYGIKRPNPHGLPIVYLARMALETCTNLNDVTKLFDRYRVIGSYGTVWSDRAAGEGMLLEVTPKGKAVKKLQGSLFWNFNHIEDSELRELQRATVDLDGWNLDRELLAREFPLKSKYEISDAVKFLRTQEAEDGTDYSWCGSKTAICNDCGLQMIVFDPGGNGLYLAVGDAYAATKIVYHIFNDFSRPPELFAKALPQKPMIKEAAKIKNGFLTPQQKLNAYLRLAQKYSGDANAQFLAARESFLQAQWDLFIDYAKQAYTLNPSVPEYRLFAGIASLKQHQPQKAVQLLDSLSQVKFYPQQELYRLTALEMAWEDIDSRKALQYQLKRKEIVNRLGIPDYYKENIERLLKN